MSKVVRFIGLGIVGILLGLGALWLTTPSQAGSNEAPVVAGSAKGSAPAPTVVSTSPRATGSPATPTPVPAPTPPAAIGQEYLALGDSVAYGIGAPDSNQQGFAGLFYNNYLRRVQPNLVQYSNLAIPGETSATFITAAKGTSQLQRAMTELDNAAAAGRRVSPVTLTLGGNDLLDAHYQSDAQRQTSLNTFETNYNQILDALKSKLNGSDLILTLYYNPFGSMASSTDSQWLQRFNDVIRKAAQAHGAKVADFFTPVTGKETSLTWITSGDVHPNPAGHAVLAQALWKATGYDTQAPRLSLTYSPLGSDNIASPNARLVFKVSAQDEWAGTINASSVAGAGSITSTTAALDHISLTTLAPLPASYKQAAPGVSEYSYIVDTSSLDAGTHVVRFATTDAAGNTGSLEISFQIR